jgi:lipopolysaccharide/colanic/teichoic acid biosynthesis glycosyltransferase
MGLLPVGVFDDDPSRKGAYQNGVPFLGPVEVAMNGEVSKKIRHVILAMPDMEPHRLEEVIRGLRERYRRVGVVPDLHGASNLWVRTAPMGPYLSLELKNNLLKPGNLMIKRAFDLALGIPLFLLSLPVILVAGIAVKLVDRGPIFYSQLREGHSGRQFRMWKIRTMGADAEQRLQDHLEANPEARLEWEERMKLAEDPRVLPVVGRFLRRYSIDEFPQLWNVLKGEMSLVGPRPYPE